MPEQGGSILRRATPLMLARLGVAAVTFAIPIPKRARALGASARARAERDLSIEAAHARLAQVYRAALTVRNDRATSPLRRKAPEVAKARETGH